MNAKPTSEWLKRRNGRLENPTPTTSDKRGEGRRSKQSSFGYVCPATFVEYAFRDFRARPGTLLQPNVLHLSNPTAMRGEKHKAGQFNSIGQVARSASQTLGVQVKQTSTGRGPMAAVGRVPSAFAQFPVALSFCEFLLSLAVEARFITVQC
jgi:hypothetical protein